MILEEMRDFISQEGGNSLIIQGKPGTGKTILALELMDMFPDHNPIIESKNTFWNRFFKKFDDKTLRVERDVSRGYKDVKLTSVR